MKKSYLLIWIIICVLLLTALSSCKKQNVRDESADTMRVQSGKTIESGKLTEAGSAVSGTSEPLAAEPDTETQTNITVEVSEKKADSPKSAEKTTVSTGNETKKSEPLPEGATGPKEQNAGFRLPEGISFKTICVEGAYCKGMEDYIPDSFAAWKGSILANAEEYVYRFEGKQIQNLDWIRDDENDRYDSRPNCASYKKFMEAFGEDGYIVIGRTTGKREGHLAYFVDIPIATISIADGFTLTDFTVDEVLFGGKLTKDIRIRENYLFGNDKELGNTLYSTSSGAFALSDGYRFLLFLKKTKNQDSYEIFGGYGGLPLTEDYKDYNQDYLDHLAGYLNLIPEDCDSRLAEALTNEENNYYDINGLVNQSDRDLKEALAANADDLIVALAQEYKIKIWPYRSKGFEDGGLPFTAMASIGARPDNQSIYQDHEIIGRW